ncbi:uncharacterized protein LOC129943422 [Eupeodes corollae]|uniref:uncharacterized protein LOC129943422 n=1 Tax=Eupeodes corollae TaxID=290404 RepID=UPI00249245EC|nr:uncharacterized protein LOC129943422 [Eupeodes corollae]XP_055908832.1 uncharacterized protein LOC129943422 [Eupeodes corollae]XP_055908833.1 uncharacterized protein LOC129943422 [Eupeodes corollae]
MAASLLIACGLNENKLPPYIHISEESNMDGGFLITSILGQRLRAPQVTTMLVGLQHGYQHYLNAGMRLGYNLTLFMNKKFFIIDALKSIQVKQWKSMWLTEGDSMSNKLLEFLREKLTAAQDSGTSLTFIIDNLSILLNFGFTPEGLLRLCQDLHAMTEEHPGLTIVTKLSTSDVQPVLDNNIAKLADVHLRVKQLKSGAFREVDGRLSVVRETTDGCYELMEQQKEILYKVNERNVKIFSPGEVGVKV